MILIGFFLPFIAAGGADTYEGSYMYMTLWGNVKGLFGMMKSRQRLSFYVQARDGEYKTKAYMYHSFVLEKEEEKNFPFIALYIAIMKKKENSVVNLICGRLYIIMKKI